jgi:Flp pilus assembly pilin Flp
MPLSDEDGSTWSSVAGALAGAAAFLDDERAAVATEYAVVMAVLTIHALGGLYAFRLAASNMLTFEQNALYNYGLNAP